MYTCVWEHGNQRGCRVSSDNLSACPSSKAEAHTLARLEASKFSNPPVSAQLSTGAAVSFRNVVCYMGAGI